MLIGPRRGASTRLGVQISRPVVRAARLFCTVPVLPQLLDPLRYEGPMLYIVTIMTR